MSENSEICEFTNAQCAGLNCTCKTCLERNLVVAKSNVKAYQEALNKVKVALLKQQVLDEIRSGIHDFGSLKYSEMLRKSEGEVRLVTISLDDKKFDDIKEAVDYCNRVIMKLKFIPKLSHWVYEQRGYDKETMGNGLHIHLIMPKTKKYPNEICRDLARPLQIAQNFVHVKTLPAEAAEKYLFGEKKDSKRDKQRFDAVMREHYGLKDKYIK